MKFKLHLTKKKFIYSMMSACSLTVLSLGVGLGIVSAPEGESNYIFGKSYIKIALDAQKNTNYLKYVESQNIASMNMVGLVATAPASALYETLQLPKMSTDIIEVPSNSESEGSIKQMFTTPNEGAVKKTSRSFATVWNSWFPGTIDNKRVYQDSTGIQQNISGFTLSEDFTHALFMLRKDATWHNGDALTANDFAQTLRYVFDLNSTSELLERSLDAGFKGADACVVEQEDYLERNGETIKDPFNIETKTPEEEEKVKSNTPSCVGMILELNEENSERISDEQIDKAGFIYNNEYGYVMYNFSSPRNVNALLSDVQVSSNPIFLPSNKKFIDSVGGLNKFGLDLESNVGNGAHILKDVVFGNLGYAKLKPNPNFWAYDLMLSGNVDVIFNTDPTTTNALFEDRKIATTIVSREALFKFNNDPELRGLLNKQTGIGSFTLAMNIPEGGNTPLNDPDLRRALYYLINRQDALKIAGWDSSFPITTFSSFSASSSRSSEQVSAEAYQDDITFDTEAPESADGKNISLRTVTAEEQRTKSNELEAQEKIDKSFKPEVAKFYLERFKKNNPDLDGVTLEFLYNTELPVASSIYTLLDSLTRKYFGGYLTINAKGVPSNFYESSRTTGQFDITTYTVEPGTGFLGYFQYFFWVDAVNDNKRSGYRNNHSGGFTFEKWFKSLTPEQETDVRERLGIRIETWDMIKFLTSPQYSNDLEKNESYNGLGLVNWKNRVRKFEALSVTEDDLNEYQNVSDNVKNYPINSSTFTTEVLAGFELILRESVPIIPLMEVDTYWTISRLASPQRRNNSWLFMFSYICDRKDELPLKILPTCEAVNGN